MMFLFRKKVSAIQTTPINPGIHKKIFAYINASGREWTSVSSGHGHIGGEEGDKNQSCIRFVDEVLKGRFGNYAASREYGRSPSQLFGWAQAKHQFQMPNRVNPNGPPFDLFVNALEGKARSSSGALVKNLGDGKCCVSVDIKEAVYTYEFDENQCVEIPCESGIVITLHLKNFFDHIGTHANGNNKLIQALNNIGKRKIMVVPDERLQALGIEEIAVPDDFRLFRPEQVFGVDDLRENVQLWEMAGFHGAVAYTEARYRKVIRDFKKKKINDEKEAATDKARETGSPQDWDKVHALDASLVAIDEEKIFIPSKPSERLEAIRALGIPQEEIPLEILTEWEFDTYLTPLIQSLGFPSIEALEQWYEAYQALVTRSKKALIEQIQAYWLKNPVSDKKLNGTRTHLYDLMGNIQNADNVSDLWTLIVEAPVPPELIAQLVNTLDRVPAENKGLAVPMLQPVKNEKGKAEESRKEEKGEDKEKGKEKEKEKEGEEEVPIVREQFQGYFFMWDRDETWGVEINAGIEYRLLHPEALELFVQKILDEGHLLAIVSSGDKAEINEEPLTKELLKSPVLQKRYGESLKEKLYSIAYSPLSNRLLNVLKNSNLQDLLEHDAALAEICAQISVLSTQLNMPENQFKLFYQEMFMMAICNGEYKAENSQLTHKFGEQVLTFLIPENIHIEIPFENDVTAVFDLRKFIASRDLAVAGDLKHLQALQVLAQKRLVLEISGDMEKIFGLIRIKAPKEYLGIEPEKIKFADDKSSVIASMRAFGFTDAVLATNDCSESVTAYYRNGLHYPQVYQANPSSIPVEFKGYTSEDWQAWNYLIGSLHVFPADGFAKEGMIYVKLIELNKSKIIQYTVYLLDGTMLKGDITAEALAAKNGQMPEDNEALKNELKAQGYRYGIASQIIIIVKERHKQEVSEKMREDAVKRQQRNAFLQDQGAIDTHLSEIAVQFGDRRLEADLRQAQELCGYVAELSGQIEDLKADIETNIGKYLAGPFQKSYILVLNNNQYEVPERAYDVFWAVSIIGEKAQRHQKNRSLATLYALQMAVSALKEKIRESKSKIKYSTLSEKIPQIEAQLERIISAQLASVETAVSRNERVISSVVQSESLSLSSSLPSSASSFSSSSASSSSSSSPSASSSSSSSLLPSSSLSSSLSSERTEPAAEEKAVIFYEGEWFPPMPIDMSGFLQGSYIWSHSNISAFLQEEGADISSLVEEALLSNQYTFSANQIIITIMHKEAPKAWRENIILENIYITFPLTRDIHVRYDLAKLAGQSKHEEIHLQCLAALASRSIVPEVNDKMYEKGLLTFRNRKGQSPQKVKAEKILIVADSPENIHFLRRLGFNATPSNAESTQVFIHDIYLNEVVNLLKDLEEKIKRKEPGYTAFLSSYSVEIEGKVFNIPDLVFHCWWALKDFHHFLSTDAPYFSLTPLPDFLIRIQNSVTDRSFINRSGFGYDKKALKAFCKYILNEVKKIITKNIAVIEAYLGMRVVDLESSEEKKAVFHNALNKINPLKEYLSCTNLEETVKIFLNSESNAERAEEWLKEQYPSYKALKTGEKKISDLWPNDPSYSGEALRAAKESKAVSDFFDSAVLELKRQYPRYTDCIMRQRKVDAQYYCDNKSHLYEEVRRAIEAKDKKIMNFRDNGQKRHDRNGDKILIFKYKTRKFNQCQLKIMS